MQALDPANVQLVRPDSGDVRAELDEEPCGVLYVGFARGIQIVVSPSASDAAMRAFSVAVTDASSRKISAPRKPL